MIAAIYARKSNEQLGVSDEEKSVTRQIDHAKAYAAKKGWIVSDQHIYVDDGISGAEFTKRPGFLRLMNALKPRPPFQVLIMSEESRLGREAIETAYALKQLITAEVHVWFYLEDRERTLETPTDKFMLSLTAFTDELERDKARQRTYDAMVRKAKAGFVTGGRVYGFDNVEVFSSLVDAQGRANRSCVKRQVNPAEAAVLRRIFELCAAGKGFISISKTLNDEGIPAPRSTTMTRKTWAPSCIRSMLYRELYRGIIVWNRTKKRTPWGTKRQTKRPETEWLRIPVPDLQIISDELWCAAHVRLQMTRESYLQSNRGRSWGRPANGVESKYLLTGLAECGDCGGNLFVRSRSHGKQRAFFYGCTNYHLRGRSACSNNLEVPMEATDKVVLTSLEQDLLQPEVWAVAIQKAMVRLRPSPEDHTAERQGLEHELSRVEKELDRLTAAIAMGTEAASPSLVKAVRERDRRKDQLQGALRNLEHLSQLGQWDGERIEGQLRAKLMDWHGLLTRQTSQARQIVRKLLVGRLRFSPKTEGDQRYYEFTGQGTVAGLLGGMLFPNVLASPTGFEPVLPA